MFPLQCDHFRSLLYENGLREKIQNHHDTQPASAPSRNFFQWLEEHGGSKGAREDIVNRVKQAEIACFRLQTAKDRQDRGEAANRTKSGGPLKPRILPRSRHHALGMPEQDFTTQGIPGKLGCPFASATSLPLDALKQNLPTPRSSLSNPDLSKNRSRRQSFADPLRARTIASRPMSPEESIAEEEPACPIRFMAQHTPEDIAKYVETHKSEMPRSHEVCVKRFQENETSVKQLDAKYGNIVSMIQDLGQKHQAMLASEKPASDVIEDDDGFDEEEQKSIEKVKAWAKDVTTEQPDANEIEVAVGIDRDIPRSEAGDEARISHFDRPLKEIRVGESPSRPWGIPIPGKFLDRTASGFSIARAPAEVLEKLQRAEAVAVLSKENNQKKIEVARGLHSAIPATQPQAKGKCPFDHRDMAARKPNDTKTLAKPDGKPAVAPADHKDALKQAEAMKPSDTVPQAAPAITEVQSTTKPSDVTNTIVNYGIAIISQPSHLDKLCLTNHGTLILGYDQAGASALLSSSTTSREPGR